MIPHSVAPFCPFLWRCETPKNNRQIAMSHHWLPTFFLLDRRKHFACNEKHSRRVEAFNCKVPRLHGAWVSVCGILLWSAVSETARAEERYVSNPPIATVLRSPAPTSAFLPSTVDASSKVAGGSSVDLVIQYTPAKIYNPATDRYDNVELRSYRDAREKNRRRCPLWRRHCSFYPAKPRGSR